MNGAAIVTGSRADVCAAAELIRRFEGGTLPAASFSHREHLALGWAYLARHGFPEGALEFRKHFRRYVREVGATGKYHETITWAYLVLMSEEMMLRSSPEESFDSMIERRPDLLDHRHGALSRCYPRSQLDSPEARSVFMLPRQVNEPSL
jgi:hypothetical protein